MSPKPPRGVFERIAVVPRRDQWINRVTIGRFRGKATHLGSQGDEIVRLSAEKAFDEGMSEVRIPSSEVEYDYADVRCGPSPQNVCSHLCP
jgi:hypothetical protein